MNNPAQKQASFSNSREGNISFSNKSFFNPVKTDIQVLKRSTYSISHQNSNPMEKNYHSNSIEKTSPARLGHIFKSLMLTLAIFVAGIGSSWGQITTTTYTFAANSTGWTGNFARSTVTNATMCGNSGMRKNLYSGVTTGNLVSPLLVGTNNQGVITLSYKYKAANYSSPYGAANPWGSFNVQVGNSATGPWTTIATVSQQTQTGTCITQTHTFTPPAGNLYIKWDCFWTAGDYYLSFDDVSVSQAAAVACSGTPAPGNTISSSATVASGGTVNLSLQTATSGTGVTYQWQSSATLGGTYANVTGGTGATTASYTTAALTTATWFRCRVTCGANTGVSNPVGVTLSYCTASGTSGYTINSVVTTSGITNISNSTGANAGYGNFTVQSASNYIGTATNFTVTHSATTGGAGVGVWIDWNNDLDFADANEQIAITTGWNYSPFTGVINIPAGSTAGNRRMRIVLNYDAISPISCPVGITGETEDYTFNVAALVACSGTPAPGNTISSAASVTPGGTVNLSLQTATSGTGVTYQWQSAPTSTGTWTNIGTSSATQTSPAITANIWFRCSVACGANIGNSTPVQVVLSACVPTMTYGCNDGDVIARVILNTLDNNSGTGCPSGVAGYSNYTTNPALTTSLLPSSSYNCVVYAGQWPANYAAWIDYNDNLVFEASERIGYTLSTVAGSGSAGVLGSSASFAVTLACNPPAGQHILRIREVYNQTNGSTITACGNNEGLGYGEIEDYKITIAAAPACPSPGLMTLVTPATTSAVLTWATNCASTTSYDFQYGPTGFTIGTGTTLTNQTVSISAPNASYTVSGLTNNTNYDVYYRANCGSGVTSAWSLVSTFTTLCAPSGNETAYGNGSWIGYVYNSASAGVFTTYKGYVTEAETFNTTHTTTPNGTTIVTCPANSDLFAIRYKMTKNFTAGNYTFQIGGDDGVRLSIDGGVTWLIDGWVNQGYTTYNSATVSLSGNVNLVFEYYENVGGGQSSFAYFSAPVIASVPSNSCVGSTITISGSNFTAITGVTINGVAATSYNVVNSSTITAVVPNTSDGVVTVNSSYGSSSSSAITIYPLLSAPSASISGPSTINVGGTAILTSSAGANTSWYTVATGGSSVGSGDNWQTPIQCTSGSSIYYAEDNNGTCPSASRTSVSITVRPMLASNPSNGLICSAGGSVTLSAQLTGAGSSITWSPNTNLSTTSGASTVASPTATTVYTMSATVAGCGSVSATQAVGVIDAVAFTPTSTPASVCAGNPAALASNLASSGFTYATTTFGMASPSSPTNLASAGVASVALTSGNLDDGGWQNIPIGFSYNFFGNNYTTLNVGTNGVLLFGAYNATSLGDYSYATAFPTATEPTNVIAAGANDFNATSGTIRYWIQGIAPTRTFVVEWNAIPGYVSGTTTSQIKLFETTGNVEIHISNNNTVGFGNITNKVVGLQNADASVGATAYSNTPTITNQAWKFIPGANYTFQWATAGANIGGATATTYTTPTLSTPGTVTYSVAATNPNTQCTTTQSVNIAVNALPSAPNSSGDVTACSTLGNQTLAVTTGAGETADWFAASTGGTVLASGDNVLSYSTATAATYYAAAQNTTTGCSSASRTGVTLNVNTSPAAPTVTTPVSYCQGAPATTLTATPTGSNTLNWYSAAPSYPAVTGATALGSAPTPSTSTAGTTNYYVSQSSSANSCESQLALVAVNVNAIPSAPVASNPAAYCQSASASALTATATAGNTLYWYTVPTGGTGSATAPTPSTATAGTTDYYVADRTDASGCEGSRTTVTVTVNPSITASVSNSASSTSACGGGAITFTATPTNGGTPAYQWYLNGAVVAGETNPTYTLATPNNADAIYVEMTPSAQTCLASSAATASNTVTLTSSAATPTVSIQSSASTAFCPGTSVTFSVNASANMGASPTYQWNLNGTPISGETSATLVNTTLANNDQVTLTMTSSLGGACLTQSDATSSAITSTVNSSTAISTQPAATAACLGGSTSFTVSATGTGTLTYQWKKTGSNVTGNASATTSTLTLSGIAAGDAANYTVDVTGTCGTVTSSAAALTINSATAISAQPSAVTQCAGTTANFSVTGSGQGTLTYQWRKDGSALSGETNSTLAVTNIATLNAGQYSVIVSGGCGNVTSSNALLTVNSGTSISTQPVASTLCAGNTVNFSVTASGTGALSYQWKQDGTNVGTNSATLSIANTQAANAGTYTVDVTGTCGALTSNNALLTVNPLTTITTQPVATSGCQGQNTTFTVVAAGTGVLSYQWKFGGVNISGATSTSYNIASTSSANDGSYLVAVTGGCGTAVNSNTVALNVYLSPSIASSITTPDFTSTAMCGTNQVAITAASIGNDSQGEWTVVGSSLIGVDFPSSTTITATAANSAMGGAIKKLVWEVSKETNGNFCYSRDTISIDFKQPVITPIAGVVATGDLLWGGLTNTTWGTASNWYQLQADGTGSAWVKLASGQPSSQNKTYTLANSVAGACISASNAPALATAGSTSSVYIGSGANMNLNAGNLTIEGNLVNNGTITPGTGTVTFSGTSAQTISGTGALANFNNLVVNKASGTLTLSQPTIVTGTLTMTQGDIVSDATNILEIGSSASSVGSVSWAGGTVRGPMKRWFATAANSTPESGVFPVGVQSGAKAGTNRYAQVNFTQSPSEGGYVVAEYKIGTPSTGYTGLPLTYSSNQYIQNYEEEGYWDITPYDASGSAYAALNTAPYTLKLRMNNPSTLQPGFPPSGSNGSAIADISKLRIITSKGPSHNTWILAGTQGSGHVVLGTGDYLLEETGVTGFSFFNGGGNDNNPLPVELLNFNGTCEEGMVNLVWQTASEFNSSHFDIEKSTDGETWRVLATIPSAGISNELLTYQTLDNNGTFGANYYRLRQVDIDGKEKLYDPINVSCVETTAGYFTSYPNPSGNEFQVVVNNKEILGACTLNIVDAQGKVIDQRSIEVKDGINMFVISETLNPGIYFLNITNGTKTTQVIKHAVK